MSENAHTPTPGSPEARPRRGKQRYAAPLGGVILLLALVGLVTIVVSGIHLVRQMVNDNSDAEKIEQIILPVLTFDPVPFDSVENADEIMVLQSAIWSAVLSDETGKYEYSIGQTLSVSATDVEAAAVKLFGPDIVVHHQTFGELEMSYFYNTDNKLYYIPIFGQIGVYSPRVEKIIERENDIYAAVVGYIPPDNAWISAYKGKKEEQDPVKYMSYEMKKVKDTYYLTAIKDVEAEDMPSSSAALPVSTASSGE